MNSIDIESHVARARELHKQGYNCCQSVVLAYKDLLPIDEENLQNLAAPFGRGLSGLREVCGCVSGMAMVCGLTGNSDAVKELAGRFRDENGDINCGRLLQMGASRRPCNDLIACAARLLGEYLQAKDENL